jgi:hypothetical protein
VARQKRHHFVPQFYLKRFADEKGGIWAWERSTDRVFRAKPAALAAEVDLYFLDEFAEAGLNPLELEQQLAHLEGNVRQITDQWIGWLRSMEPGDAIEVPPINRREVALFLSVQWFRTVDQRDIFAAFAEGVAKHDLGPPNEIRKLHTQLLWSRTVKNLANRIKKSSWIFAINRTDVPFKTSDNPVAFRTGDNSKWVKVGFYEKGTYLVYPLSPDIVMYCHPREAQWKALSKFDLQLSPVTLTSEMVDSENLAHVFLASRFVFSPINQFESEREFAPTVGTDKFAEFWLNLKGQI